MPTVSQLNVLVLRAAQAIEYGIPADRQRILDNCLNHINAAMTRDFGSPDNGVVIAPPDTRLGPHTSHIFDNLETALSVPEQV